MPEQPTPPETFPLPSGAAPQVFNEHDLPVAGVKARPQGPTLGKQVANGAIKGAILMAIIFGVMGGLMTYVLRDGAAGAEPADAGGMIQILLAGALFGAMFGSIGAAIDWVIARARRPRA